MNADRFLCVLLVLSLVAALACTGAPGSEQAAEEDVDREVIELIPNEPPSWTPLNVLAPITGLVLGPGYWYANREIEIDTTPPGAMLDLFYVRRNFQKRYEQADAPILLVLPPRIEATSRDSITIRALRDGYQQREVHVRVRSRKEKLTIELDPLPNSLVAFTHTYFAGRASLTFLTTEALAFRLQRNDQGIVVVLTQTAKTPEANEMLEGVHSAFVESVSPQQLGEDLLVRVALSERARGDSMETRSRQDVDPVRGLHSFALDLVPSDRGAADIERARAALARIGPQDATGCALEFDSSLRAQLEPAALARALAPNGAYTDKFLRAAMKRLGEVSPDGVIAMADGTRYRGAIPLELMAAASQAGDAVGYLSVLRRFVAELEPERYRRETLRGLLAPELAPSRFEVVYDAAESRERSCRAMARGSARVGGRS